MADANKTSFLGSISPWIRSSTPPPKSPRQLPKQEESLRQSSGNDHLISLRPTPSLRRYPKDCPPLKTRWYFAVDVAKRKPLSQNLTADQKSKPPPVPKKWVSFSQSDSRAVENAFQALDTGDLPIDQSSGKPTSTRVPVNEDYLYDVHVEQRELEPAFWLGPVYEVRRGSWFMPDGTPCDENLARQLEEGYIKVMPWRRSTAQTRSASQTRPSSRIIDAAVTKPTTDDASTDTPISNTMRLFGAHMNTIVTYQDATAAYLSSDDFMSRIGSTVYTRLVGQSGTRVTRGYVEAAKPTETKATDAKDGKTAAAASASSIERGGDAKAKAVKEGVESALPRPSLVERQLSSLAGLRESQDEEKLAEEDDRKVQEQEMEDTREKDGEDQGRKIDHLILVTHGIGQRLGLRLDSINFVHDVNTLRKTMKAVYATSPDLQALTGSTTNCHVQVLPVCWRHLLDFPKQSLKHNRKEFDLGDMDSAGEDEYPSLHDITVEGVPAVRNLITDLAMDVLLYQSAYREHIASIVQQEANRVYHLFKDRTGFEGKVSLCGHSLGSAVVFDLLCRQAEHSVTRPRRVSIKTARSTSHSQDDLKLDFDCDSFFALGSPIALFQMLKGRTIAGRSTLHDKAPVTSPFDTEVNRKDPFSAGMTNSHVPITVSSPKCAEIFNIFHPTDPIAYRMEPLISSAMAQMKPQMLPYVKKGLFGAPGIANMTARVGQQVMSSWYSLTSGVASSLINRSLGITGDEQALPQDRPRQGTIATEIPPPLITTGSQYVPGNSQQAPTNQQKQQDLAAAANLPGQPETLIDTEIETLYSGFQKRTNKHQRDLSVISNASAASTGEPPRSQTMESAKAAQPEQASAENEKQALRALDTQSQARRLKREEAKVRALNSNGRVDYAIQEGMFDVSLLASIASHLSYWADEDVNHFMIGELLKKGRGEKEKERGRQATVVGSIDANLRGSGEGRIPARGDSIDLDSGDIGQTTRF